MRGQGRIFQITYHYDVRVGLNVNLVTYNSRHKKLYVGVSLCVHVAACVEDVQAEEFTRVYDV